MNYICIHNMFSCSALLTQLSVGAQGDTEQKPLWHMCFCLLTLFVNSWSSQRAIRGAEALRACSKQAWHFEEEDSMHTKQHILPGHKLFPQAPEILHTILHFAAHKAGGRSILKLQYPQESQRQEDMSCAGDALIQVYFCSHR